MEEEEETCLYMVMKPVSPFVPVGTVGAYWSTIQEGHYAGYLILSFPQHVADPTNGTALSVFHPEAVKRVDPFLHELYSAFSLN